MTPRKKQGLGGGCKKNAQGRIKIEKERKYYGRG